MRKLTAIILAALTAILCFAGCGKSKGKSESASGGSGTTGAQKKSSYTIKELLDSGPQLLITMADDNTAIDRDTAVAECRYFKDGKMYYVYPTDKNGLKVGADGIYNGEPLTVGFFAKMTEEERLRYAEENKHLTDGGSMPYMVIDATLAGLKLPLPEKECYREYADKDNPSKYFNETSYSEYAKTTLMAELESAVTGHNGFKKDNRYYLPLTLKVDDEASKVNNANLSWEFGVKFRVEYQYRMQNEFHSAMMGTQSCELWCDGSGISVRHANSDTKYDYVPLSGATPPGSSIEWIPVGNEILDDGSYTPFFVTDGTGNNIATESFEISIRHTDAVDPVKEKVVNFIASSEPVRTTIYSTGMYIYGGSVSGRDCLLSFLTEDGVKVRLDGKGTAGIEVE